MAEFFSNNIIGIFFFYGLAFFTMGLAVWLETNHSSELDFSRALRPLAGFGLVHGSHEWFEMALIIHASLSGLPEPHWVYYLRLALLGISFLMLIAFGIRLVLGPRKTRLFWQLIALTTLLWLIGLGLVLREPFPDRILLVSADVYTRYALAIPGAALTAWGLFLQSREFRKAGMHRFELDLIIAAIAFALYGGIGQLFVSPSTFYPSTILNSDLFLRWFSFPIQGFRALMAIVAAIFIIHSLRAFEVETRLRIQALHDAKLAEQKHLQFMKSELLHRTVQAQEQERQRIARELHDETGQTLTALGLGLQGLSKNIQSNPQRAIQQSHQLQELATNGLVELQRLVTGLHPPQLDELGLLAALRWYAQEMNKHFAVPITVTGSVNDPEIPPAIRLAVYRITQEAITNTIRHAQAKQVLVIVESENGTLHLNVEDDGRGFSVEDVLEGDPTNCLGLLGMIERANLVGGECKIISTPGEGTNVEVQFQLV
jgi:signal transduction histidine kinase